MYILIECEERNIYLIYQSESEEEVIDKLKERFFEKLLEEYDEDDLKDVDLNDCEVYGDDFSLSADGCRAWINGWANYDWKIFKI